MLSHIKTLFTGFMILDIGAIGLAFVFGMKEVALKLVLFFGVLCIAYWMMVGYFDNKSTTEDSSEVIEQYQP